MNIRSSFLLCNSTKIVSSLLLVITLFFTPLNPAAAIAQSTDPQATRLIEAAVTNVKSQETTDERGQTHHHQIVDVLVTSGNEKGQTIQIEVGAISSAKPQSYDVGNKVQVIATTAPDGDINYQISDYVRRSPLLILFILFVGITLLVSRKRGFMSLIAMALSFGIVFVGILPLILAGWNPILVSLSAALVMIPVTFYMSHGINRKTTVAVAGTLASLLFTALLAHIFINVARLSGFSSDEAGMIQAAQPDIVNMQGLILAGIILGLSGVLDDITISQSAIVHQLKQASPNISFKELYTRAMDVGRDHIASLVNTLILVYTGAAMPLLLLFTQSSRPFMEVINYEIIAEEVVRTLVVSIGIILSVPLTTFLAAYWERLPHKTREKPNRAS